MSTGPQSAAGDAPRVVLVAGEASGDQLGAALVEALQSRLPGVECAGVGGPRMRSKGFEAWWGIEELSVMGLFEVVRHLPRLLRLRRQLVRRTIAFQPDLVIGIDAPDFNLGVEKRVRLRGMTTVHYVSPTVWAWRQGRARTIGESADLVLCLFPFEPAFYHRHGVRAEYTGHPLADSIPFENDPLAAREALGLAPDATTVALLPGSRGAEVGKLAEPLLDAARRLAAAHPGMQFVAPMASPGARALFEQAVSQANDDGTALRIALPDGQALEALTAADVAVCASGTATLECLLVNRPMVVVYRLSGMTYAVGKALDLVKTEHVSLPNLLAGEALVPELIQHEANGKAIAEEVETWLSNAGRGQRLRERFDQIHRELRTNAAASAADACIDLLRERGRDA